MSRGIEKSLLMSFMSCEWILGKQNVFVVGQTGVGKTYVVCALGQRACLEGMTVRYYRVPRLMTEMATARALGRSPQLLAQLSKIDLLILDDWGLTGLSGDERRDLLEIVEDRYGLRSTAIASQLPVERWHELVGEATIADAILDRLVHSAHRIHLSGVSQRKARSVLTAPEALA